MSPNTKTLLHYMWANIVLCSMFVIVYTKHDCVYMFTQQTVHLLSCPYINIQVYIFVYVRMYVCMYLCMYECMFHYKLAISLRRLCTYARITANSPRLVKPYTSLAPRTPINPYIEAPREVPRTKPVNYFFPKGPALLAVSTHQLRRGSRLLAPEGVPWAVIGLFR